MFKFINHNTSDPLGAKPSPVDPKPEGKKDKTEKPKLLNPPPQVKPSMFDFSDEEDEDFFQDLKRVSSQPPATRNIDIYIYVFI